jgi:hypothetical protein
MMPLALLLLAGWAGLIPARWNSGDPRSLELLKGGAVNCILVESRNWNSALVQAGKRQQISIFGVIRMDQDAAELSRKALELKLNGVVLEGEDQELAPVAGLTVVRLASRASMRLFSGDPIVGAWQGLWPGIEIEHGGGSATAGPTSTPWINTNAGFLRFARAATGAAAIWVGERPPPGVIFPAQRYGLAIGDAAMAGARWIIGLDADLERRLLAGESAALAAWKQIGVQVRYWDNPRWREYRPAARLLVVQDAASGGLLSAGILDLLAVLHISAQPAPAPLLGAAGLQGARVVVNLAPQSLSAKQKGELQEFARAGGVVVNPPANWRFPDLSPQQITTNRRQLDRIQPIWEATYDATLRKNFGVRTFNTASVLFHLLAAPGGGSLLVHLLNYADYPAEDITVQVLGTWRRARLYCPDAESRELPVYAVKDGTGVDVDRIRVAATLRFD